MVGQQECVGYFMKNICIFSFSNGNDHQMTHQIKSTADQRKNNNSTE
jgi:hypothetical protein